jgi:UDP-N-acetylmuramoylalanine--D-glutamate ligase
LRTLVYGLARSGRSAAERLEERGDDVVLVDRSLGNEDDLGLLEGVELLVKSPGVPGEAPLVAAARERGVPVWSEVELGWRLLAPAGTCLVGVTGTNGKTTTTELLGAIFRAAGRDVAVAGNVGTPLTSVRGAEWVVCELSSFQLEDVHELACDVAVLLNLEPDHLDRHGTFEAYRDAKLRIFERARAKVVPRGLGLEGGEFSADDPLPAEPLIRGAHNRENAAAATAAARAARIGDEPIAEALRTFPGVPHRLELVAERDGVRFVNDSKATNVAAAMRALAAYADEPVHLILGGSPKGEDFAPLGAAIGPNVRSVHLIGAEAERLAQVTDGHRDETLERAVEHAMQLAAPGDVVLLSPACASFDQFEDFEHRGDVFRDLVG